MKLSELNNFLENEDVWWTWKDKDLLLIHSKRWDETIELNMKNLPNISPEQIKMCLINGKDIEHITRVTGYFSVISKWNPGKTGELRDRHRVSPLLEMVTP